MESCGSQTVLFRVSHSYRKYYGDASNPREAGELTCITPRSYSLDELTPSLEDRFLYYWNLFRNFCSFTAVESIPNDQPAIQLAHQLAYASFLLISSSFSKWKLELRNPIDRQA
jgi:hypothetical protein